MDVADIVIIGAGAGAKLIWGSVPGRSVAVVEQGLVGGYCPFFACVPSKAMLRSASVWGLGANEQFSGLFTGQSDETVAYQQAVARRERIVHGRDDSLTAAALKKTGARLLRGTGRVVQPGVVEVDGTRVEYRDLVLNTGSTPLIPEVPGLDAVPAWTSEQAMSAREQPRSIAVIGGGPVGCELAYLFAVLGTQATLIQHNARLIPREEPEASDSMAERLTAVGVRVLLGDQVASAQPSKGGARLTQETERPSFIRLRTHIAWGAPNAQDTSKAHGAALGEDEVRATKEAYGWNPDKHFKVPEGVPERWQARVAANREARAAWQGRLRAYAEAEPALAAELQAALAGELPAGWDADLDKLFAEPKKQATRKASQQVINALGPNLPALVGGSADLAESNLTDIAGGGDLTATEAGRNLRFGVREHGMGAISNGLAAHGALRPFCATFLVFSDYMRPSVRLASLMGLPVIYVWTHDSIGLGGDGPTHQPIEHLASLRLLPNLHVIRPADGPETAEAWRAALRRTDGPTALALSRQELPPIDRERYASAAGLHRGAYVLAEASDGEPELILLATGSEVWLALAAREELEQRQEIPTRVVSMPCWELFEAQDQAYRDQVLPPQVTARLAVEAGSTGLWHKWVGTLGGVVGIDQFGASAPGGTALSKFGFTEDNVVERALAVLHREHIEKARMLRNLSA